MRAVTVGVQSAGKVFVKTFKKGFNRSRGLLAEAFTNVEEGFKLTNNLAFELASADATADFATTFLLGLVQEGIKRRNNILAQEFQLEGNAALAVNLLTAGIPSLILALGLRILANRGFLKTVTFFFISRVMVNSGHRL